VTHGKPRPVAASVVIPTFNRREWLRRLLLALDEQDDGGPSFEVIVVVDGATDGSIEMLAQFDSKYPLRVVTQANNGPAAARNRGLGAATGDVIIFLDDDVVPTTSLIARHLEPHQRDRNVAVLGRIAASPERIRMMTPWAGHEMELLDRHYEALSSGRVIPGARHFFTANASVRREHLRAVGGFDVTFHRSEDVELGYRLAERGLHFHFAPQAEVLHESDHNLDEWLTVPYKYGRQDVVMARDHGRPGALVCAFREWHTRHVLTRAVARRCVGSNWGRGFVTAIFSQIIRSQGPKALFRLKMAMCGALFNVQYWQGVADATGTGAAVWRGLSEPSAIISAQAHPQGTLATSGETRT
jgi:GT2 family glycosyltransferase